MRLLLVDMSERSRSEPVALVGRQKQRASSGACSRAAKDHLVLDPALSPRLPMGGGKKSTMGREQNGADVASPLNGCCS